MPAWSSGQRIAGRYRLERPIGAGGTAEAWAASDTLTTARVLIKLPRSTAGASTQAAAASFDREYDASRSVDHPDVPRALAHGSAGEQPFLVTVSVEGRSLSERRGQPFAVLAPYLISLARTLACVHEKGWVHRDVKAGNVLTSGEHRALLADFGLAARIGERQPPNGGSPFSRSPQQAAGLPAEPADDLYSFGALLYELLSGNPPHFPDRAAVAVVDRRPPRMEPVYPVPDRMAGLIGRLLAPDPAARPASMRAVVEELAKVLETLMSDKQPLGGSGPQGPQTFTKAPVWRAPGEGAAPAGRAARSSWWPWAIGLAFVAAAFIVFVVLPEHAPQPPAVAQPAVAPTAPAAARDAAADASATAGAREGALRAQGRFEERIAALDKRSAATWSGPELALARVSGLDGARQVKAEEFADALASYGKALDHIGTVEAAAPQALERALDRGAAAVAGAKVAEATQAYQLALAIDPTNVAAQRGLKRAGAIDAVQALVVQASRAASANDWPAAVQAYRKALALDSDTVEARTGLEAAERKLAEAQYQTAMAEALRDLNLRRFAGARAAIGRAQAIRPSAAEPRDLAARVNTAIAGTRIEDLRVEANGHEREERWSDALTIYESILGRNATLLFAREGKDRVTPRVKLDTRLNDYIARPERLGSNEVRDAARRALGEAAQVANAGPVLKSQVAKVEAILSTAAMPVRVALESDAATQVVIYQVGPLGVFTRREVDLPPGNYTVLGTRAGFRDVRRELRVRSGEVPPALVVRCEDPI